MKEYATLTKFVAQQIPGTTLQGQMTNRLMSRHRFINLQKSKISSVPFL